MSDMLQLVVDLDQRLHAWKDNDKTGAYWTLLRHASKWV
jgi:hypothetical protein